MLRILAPLFMLCLPAIAAAQTLAPAPVSAYAAVPTASHPALAPDGGRLAFGHTRPDGGKDVVILDLKDGKPARIGLRDMRLESLQFEEDGRLLAEASQYYSNLGAFDFSGWITRTYAVRMPDAVIRVLLGREEEGNRLVSGARFVSQLDGQPGQVALETYDRTMNTPTWNLFRAGVTGDQPVVIGRGLLITTGWGVSAAGEPIVRVDHDLKTRTTTLLMRRGGDWTPVLTETNEPSPSVDLLGPLDQTGFLIRRTGRARTGAFERLNLSTGALSPAVQGEGVPLRGAWLDPWTSTVAGIRFGGAEPGVAWLDPDLGRVEADLRAALNGPARLQSWTKDRSTFAVLLEGAAQPPVLYLYDDKAKRLRELIRGNPGLAGVPLGARRVERLDGPPDVTVPVAFTFPPGADEPKGRPAVVLLRANLFDAWHDEPTTFDWLGQFLASRGYVVIEPAAIQLSNSADPMKTTTYEQWAPVATGRVAAALELARAKGWADPARTCVIGRDFMFLIALESALRTENRIGCLVGVDGIADLASVLDDYRDAARSDLGRHVDFGLGFFKDQFGPDRAALAAASPSRRIGSLQVDTLLLANGTERYSSFAQNREIAAALREAAKTVETVRIVGSDFDFSRSDARAAYLGHLETFLAAQLGGAAP